VITVLIPLPDTLTIESRYFRLWSSNYWYIYRASLSKWLPLIVYKLGVPSRDSAIPKNSIVAGLDPKVTRFIKYRNHSAILAPTRGSFKTYAYVYFLW